MKPTHVKKPRPAMPPLDLRRDALGQEPLYDPLKETGRAVRRREKALKRRRPAPRPSSRPP